MDVPKFTTRYLTVKPLMITSLEKGAILTPDDLSNNYMPYCIDQLQNYNPVFSTFFDVSPVECQDIGLNHKYLVHDLESVFDTQTGKIIPKPVFVKFAPLLDPIKYMTGKYERATQALYGAVKNLPTCSPDDNSACLPKIKDSNNASYVDNFFNYLSNQLCNHHKFVHGIEYYGSCLCVQDKFKMNITDDLEYLSESQYFIDNYNKLYTTTHPYISEFVKNTTSSRANKNRIMISESGDHNISAVSISNDDLGEIDALSIQDDLIDNVNLVYEKSANVIECVHTGSINDGSEGSMSDGSDESNSDGSASNSDDGSSVWETETSDSNDDTGDEESESGSESEEDEVFQYAYVNNFPVQMIFLEKCDGTLDELFVKKQIEGEEGMAMLFQIIMTLVLYQKTFHFTHNDLHTNNIMYNTTDIEYLYYKYKNTTYRVPTYGKIYKIIDFGRAIYRYNGKLLCSDSFANGGDAATQYNCEPYEDTNKPRIDPNYSFDLCRLACSIYDFIIPENMSPDKYTEFQTTICRWCTDDNDKNVLYKKNWDERYPGFKLYKMIARTVHRHTPDRQLDSPSFQIFRLHQRDCREPVMDFDKIPSYVTV